MLVQQDTVQFNGFGQGNIAGKYTFSSGFKRTDNGAAPSWRITNTNSVATSAQYWLTQLGQDVWSVGQDGDLHVNGALIQAVGSSVGQGLIADQKGRLLYARTTTLGMYDGVSTYTDSWKTGLTSFTGFRPMELYEDMVLIGDVNEIAVLFTSDDSFATSAFVLPDNFTIRCIKAGKTGILIGANIANRGYLILWDGNTLRSIAPWIPLSNVVLSITTDDNGNWIVATRDGFFVTNGYSIESYAKMPVKEAWTSYIGNTWRGNILPQGTEYKDGKLFVAYTPAASTPTAKMPGGVWVYDSATILWEHIPTSDNHRFGGYVGALFFDTALKLRVTYGTTSPTADDSYGYVEEASASKSVLITEELGQSNNPKYAEGLKATIRFSPNGTDRYSSHHWTVTAKIYDFKRQLYGFGLTNNTSASANQIKNMGDVSKYQGAQVGDEVTVLNGANAGQIRHISSIANAGTNTETWMLDSALPNNTESDVYLQVMPFKSIGTKSLTGSNDYYFNIKNHPKGKRFLVKYIFETSDTSTMIPELIGQSFIYDDNPKP